MRKPIPFFVAVVLGIMVDLASKQLIFAWLFGQQNYVLIPNVLQLTRAWNPGAAFSILSNQKWILLVVTIALMAGGVWYYFRIWRTARATLLVSLALLMIGAAGNLYDRLLYQHVRDFIDFMPELPWIGHWAVFNVADICITIGVILYVIHLLFLDKPAEKAVVHSENFSSDAEGKKIGG